MESVQPVFSVRSVHEALAWYRDVLQLQPVFRNEVPGREGSLNYAVLRSGNAGLHLGLERDMEIPAGRGACNFTTRELDATYERAREAGAELFIELGTIPTGARTFGIKDPDGNLITFVEEP